MAVEWIDAASISPNQCSTRFYSVLEETLVSLPRSNIKLVLRDFNAKVTNTDSSDAFYGVVGSHGLGTRKERGDTLLQF